MKNWGPHQVNLESEWWFSIYKERGVCHLWHGCKQSGLKSIKILKGKISPIWSINPTVNNDQYPVQSITWFLLSMPSWHHKLHLTVDLFFIKNAKYYILFKYWTVNKIRLKFISIKLELHWELSHVAYVHPYRQEQ